MEQPKCHEKEISYPVNDAMTCWWLALNICFFHKRRAEFEDFFNTAPTEQSVELSKYNSYYAKIQDKVTNVYKTRKQEDKDLEKQKKQNLYQIYKCVYYFYTNQHEKLKEVIEAMNSTVVEENKKIKIPTTDEEKQQFMINLRTRPEMKDYFNTFTINPTTKEKKPGFTVDGTMDQDADEYITKLFDMFQIFDNILIKNSLQNEYTITNIYMLNTIVNLYDIEIWTKLEIGEKPDYKEGEKQKENKINTYITTNTNTLVLKINPYSNKNTKIVKNIEIQETIEIPLVNIYDKVNVDDIKDSIEVYTFELDAIVCFRRGHYYGYVKCSGADKWLKYGAMTKGKLEKELDFEEVKNSKDIKEETLMLFYTKAEQVKEENPIKEEDKEETKEEEKEEEKSRSAESFLHPAEKEEGQGAPEVKGASEGQGAPEAPAAEKLDIKKLKQTITTFINDMPNIAGSDKNIYKLLQQIIYSTEIKDFDGIIKISNLKLNDKQLDYMKRLHNTIILMNKSEKEYRDTKHRKYIESIQDIYTQIDNAIMQKINSN
jgi:hypothetical protein